MRLMGNMRTFVLMAAMTALLMGLGWLLGGSGPERLKPQPR